MTGEARKRETGVAPGQEAVVRALPRAAGTARDALAEGEVLHRAFRPGLPADYAAHMEAMFADGAHMVQLVVEGRVAALAVWRSYLTAYSGRVLVIDDLVTDENVRSRGYGRTLLHWLEGQARSLDCDALHLDSGVQRGRAHAFYFRERMHISGFHFSKTLDVS